MFRFEHPYYLWLLLLIPVFWLLQLLHESWRKRKLSKVIDANLAERLTPLASRAKAWIRLSVNTIAFASLIIGIANPQIGSKMEEVKRKGVDIMLALDISNSMQAEDLYPNRLERSKRSIQELLTYLKADRLGIVVFAGDAFVQLPITTDYSAAKLFLNSIQPRLIARQGTDIGTAIRQCMDSFDEESPTQKVIIVISDGENHEPAAMEAAQEAAANGIVIHTIGMGSMDGSPIPVYVNGQRVGFRKNKEGNTVVSKLDESMLRQLASEGGGMFFRATNAQSGMSHIFEEVEKMEKVEFGTKVYTDFEDRFQYLLLPALILLVIELIIPNRKSLWWEKLFAS